MVNSKNKGGNFERLLAKEISLWLTNNEDDSIVWRTASSGAMASQRLKKNKKVDGFCGDLTFTDIKAIPFFNIFSLEAKKGYNDTNPLSEIDSNSEKHSFIQNLKQCINDARKSNKEPFFVFMRDRKKKCCCFLSLRFNHMRDTFGELDNNIKYLKFWNGEEEFIIMTLNDFFNWANPEYFNKL